MADVKDFYQDPVLTDLSVKYTNQDFIAERVFPTLSVSKKTGFYFTYDRSNLKTADDVRAGVSRANRVDYTMVKTAFGPLVEHSLEMPIEYDIIEQADSPLDPRVDAVMAVTERLMINKEHALATMLNDTAKVTQNVTLTGGNQWSDYTNSDPFTNIQTAKDTVQKNGLVAPNTCWMSYEVWSKLQHHPKLLERVKYSERGVITEEIFASLFGFANVFIGRAVRNSAPDGQADSMTYIWPKSFWVGYVAPTPALRTVSAGYYLQLTNGRVVDRWDEPQVKAEFVRVTDYFEAKIVAQEAIYLIKNAIA